MKGIDMTGLKDTTETLSHCSFFLIAKFKWIRYLDKRELQKRKKFFVTRKKRILYVCKEERK